MNTANAELGPSRVLLPRPIDLSIGWLADRPAVLWRLVAIGLLTLLSVLALFQNSVVIDGTRYFYLDDDQMISMRYARNLAEGHGPVWNPGERVEGYTNPLWTLVMAGVHLLPIGDAKTSLAVLAINWLLACAVLLLSERLLRLFVPKPGLALPVLLITLALCHDLTYWSVLGFETTMLTELFLLVVVRILSESETGQSRPATYILIGLLPLVRSDAFHVWAAAALLALGLSSKRSVTLRLLALSLILPVLHLLFRYWYYGEWLPNTYYLKVYQVPDRTVLGLKYLAGFVRDYGVGLLILAIGAIATRDRRSWLFIGGLSLSAGYSVVVGGDIFRRARFFAHLIPVLFALMLFIINQITRRRSVVQTLLLLILSLSVLFQTGVYSPSVLQTGNGNPKGGVVAGVLIERYTRPEATVAVFAAGDVPYFSHRYAIDLLGKSDAYIARLEPHAGGIGHNKFDPDYSLGLAPDLFASHIPHNSVQVEGQRMLSSVYWYGPGMFSHPVFQQDYLPHPVDLPYLLDNTPVYIHSSSPELAGIELWKEPEVSW